MYVLVEKGTEHSKKKHSYISKNKCNNLNMLIFPNRHRASRSRNRNEINSNRALTGSCDSHAKSWMSLNNLEDDLLNEDYKNVILTSDSNENLAKFDETPALDDNVLDICVEV